MSDAGSGVLVPLNDSMADLRQLRNHRFLQFLVFVAITGWFHAKTWGIETKTAEGIALAGMVLAAVLLTLEIGRFWMQTNLHQNLGLPGGRIEAITFMVLYLAGTGYWVWAFLGYNL